MGPSPAKSAPLGVVGSPGLTTPREATWPREETRSPAGGRAREGGGALVVAQRCVSLHCITSGRPEVGPHACARACGPTTAADGYVWRQVDDLGKTQDPAKRAAGLAFLHAATARTPMPVSCACASLSPPSRRALLSITTTAPPIGAPACSKTAGRVVSWGEQRSPYSTALRCGPASMHCCRARARARAPRTKLVLNGPLSSGALGPAERLGACESKVGRAQSSLLGQPATQACVCALHTHTKAQDNMLAAT